MKIQSLLNKNTKIIFLIIISVIVITYWLLPKDNLKVETVYHTSQWNEYSKEIDKSIKLENLIIPAELKHVYGGVVSHHIPTTIPKLVEFYSTLKKTQKVKNFIIIGPDHTDAGKSPITTSNASFFTIYGQLKPMDGLAFKLQELGLANIEESPFDREHSIGSQVLIISKIFPEAKVTPIILRSNATKAEAEKLGKLLATLLDEDTVLIASVDFSHYLTTDQATPLDQISGEIIRKLDINSLPLMKIDSIKSAIVFMMVMKEKKAIDTSNFDILNTNDLMQNSDYTTGYVFGFWGIK